MSSSHLPFGLKSAVNAPEKSNFAHVCNLLSQYVKEKGSLKDLNLVGIARKMEATGKPNVTIPATNLLTNIGQSSSQQIKPVDSLPQFTSVVPEKEEMETKRSQMTIFYGGKVLVFDDLTADKAREVMQLASDGSSTGDLAGAEKYSSADALPSISKAAPPPVSVSAQERPQLPANALASSSRAPPPVVPVQERPHPPANAPALSSRAHPPPIYVQEKPQPPANALASGSRAPPPLGSLRERPQPQAEANTSDLPIARRSSLHRFLEKRKDRAVARGPYHQVQNARASSSSKNEEQLELKL